MKILNKLRNGYTTGTCAAAAAKAAAFRLLTGKSLGRVDVTLPEGQTICLTAREMEVSERAVRCGVIKDAGDDPDITDGMMICASVRRRDDGQILIDGGEGVGRVTLPGLDQPVGAAAINSVPRRMIREAVEDVAGLIGPEESEAAAGKMPGFDVIIDIPGGREAAAKTLNASLGIVGGLSVLGTTGIVKPMSEQALLDTIRVEISQRLALGDEVLYMTPGNYGETFMQAHYPQAAAHVIKVSNYIGDSMDMALEAGAKAICLTGHIGKMVKVAGGIMNTHSRNGDARMEILAANAILCGADAQLAKEILEAKTTDAGIELLEQAGLTGAVMGRLLMKIEAYLSRRVAAQVPVGVVIFSNVYGLLGKNAAADRMLEEPREPGDGSVVSFGAGSEVKE